MKILACTDGSEQSLKALQQAAKISKCFNGEVTVIHVENFIPHLKSNWPYYSEETFKELEERNKENVARIMADAVKLFEEENIKIKTLIKVGHPSETILRVASEERFNMIIIGSRGMGSFKKLLLGSVSNAVAQVAAADVLIVKG